ncbi:MAG: 50S ribosomal protein L21 [Vampirovibrionales bacterium]
MMTEKVTKKAVLQLNNKQYEVEEQRYLFVDLLDAEIGTELTVDTIQLLVDGETVKVGQPFVSGASATLKVLGHMKGKKVIVFKYRPKKGYRRKNGHRQQYTKVSVEAIKG